jgi:hypothetical protein
MIEDARACQSPEARARVRVGHRQSPTIRITWLREPHVAAVEWGLQCAVASYGQLTGSMADDSELRQSKGHPAPSVPLIVICNGRALETQSSDESLDDLR